jgi:cation:H+ antiporter
VIFELIVVIIGLAGLWLGSDFLVRGTKTIARSFGFSQLFVGLTIVSIGTSIPEIAVSITSGLDRLAGIEASGIAVGNAIGSALSQTTLLIGILAFLVPLVISKRETLRQGAFFIGAALLLFFLGLDGELSRWDGVWLLGFYGIYMIILLSTQVIRSKAPEFIWKEFIVSCSYVLFGTGIILLSSDIVVDFSIQLATMWNVKQSLVGVLLVGIGTGLPELSVAISSARQKAMAIGMGDLVGSNICDLLLSIGAGTVIAGFVVDPILVLFDLPMLIVGSSLTMFFLYTRRQISWVEGATLIAVFTVYVVMKLVFFM